MRPASRPESKPRRPAAGPIVAAESLDSGAGATSALQKGFSLLEHLVEAERALTLAELVAQMDLPKATVHRLLMNLEAAQLLKRDVTGKRYVPGDRLTRFSLRAVVFSARMSPVRAVLERLVAEIGESINLGVLDGTSVAYVQRVECNWPLRTHLSAGSRVPLHCTATGKLFLALMPTARRTALLDEIELRAYSPNTITNRKRLDEELAHIRDERLAVNNEEFMVGAIGLSVPLMGIDGEMIAGLALHAPVARVSIKDARAHTSTLRRAAEKLARTLL
ncbi:MAG: IclR family transcriptional regulator, acetate operon repressor [Bradyrhizobium sp.]|nr:IclR family transcriptional regulator, acetate operon repressor [Bradyrhizobium sp.]